jgi:hypothetical protein
MTKIDQLKKYTIPDFVEPAYYQIYNYLFLNKSKRYSRFKIVEKCLSRAHVKSVTCNVVCKFFYQSPENL